MENHLQPVPALRPAADQRTYVAFGDHVTFHLTGADTGGRYTVFTDVTMPGGGPPPHTHAREDECFFVLEGRASFLLDGEWREAGPGDSVFAPRNSLHTFKNPGDTPLKMLVTASPAGFEVFFARCAEEFAKPGGPDFARILEMAGKHGIQFPPPATGA